MEGWGGKGRVKEDCYYVLIVVKLTIRVWKIRIIEVVIIWDLYVNKSGVREGKVWMSRREV